MKKIKSKFILIVLLTSFSISVAESRIKSFYDLKFSNIDRQMEIFTCGIAVLATTFTYYYGIPVKEEIIAKDFFSVMVEEERGISFLDMRRFARAYGFEAYGFRTNYSGLLEILKKTPLPVIVHTKKSIGREQRPHFSILVGIIDDYFVLDDTASGSLILEKKDFLSEWTGYLLVIVPPKESDAYKKAYQRINEQRKEKIKRVQKIYFHRDIKPLSF